MRNHPRQDEDQEQPRPAPTKPPVRWVLENGRQVRSYACAYCRDMGIVILPAHKPGETDADLLMVNPPPGKTYSYRCPKCQGGAMWSAQELDQWQKDRMARWYRAKEAALREDAARAALERIDRPKLPAVVRTMPALSTFEQESIAAEMRRGGE